MKYTNNTIRINFVFIICIVLLFALFFGKMTYVALNENVEGTNIAELAKNRSTATRTLKADRGNIYDYSGKLLAQNMNAYTIIAYLSESRTSDDRYPKHVVDKEMTAEKLSLILEPLNKDMTKENILKLLSRDKYQVELRPKDITETVKKQIEELALPGIDFIKTKKRYYPNGDFASYIIGYAKKNEKTQEIKGEMGIEGYCNRYLQGKDGTVTYQKDAYGYPMANKTAYTVDAEEGLDVYLTLDSQVQIFLDNAVKEFEKYNPKWVTLTVADAKTGAIIGSSTSPSFNINTLNIEEYNNPLTSYTYEPGSTMKIFSFMSAMEEKKYDGNATYHSGTIQVGDYKIKDWNKVGWGEITFDTGFTYSSNTAAVLLAQSIKREKLMKYYTDLGFGTQTGIELSGELKGEIDFQYESELATASYGQGITVTPIQMIQALSVVTNDGTVLKPYVIDKIVDPNSGEVVYQGKRTELKKVYSTSTVNKIIELMDKTVNGEDKASTGQVYHTDALRLIGKTGTANYIGEDGKYITGSFNNIRSFAGVFPKENPEYILYIAVKDFEGSSKNMGAIIQNMVESVAKYRNLDERPSDKDESKIVSVPNMLNSSLISSAASLNSKGIDAVVIGDGNTIISQYPKANTKTSQKSKVFLVTNGTKYTMPNVIGWSSADLIDFCNIIGVKYNLKDYGYVSAVNINAGEQIDPASTIIEATLTKLEPKSLIPKKEE